MMTENATTDKTGIMMIVKNIMIVLTMFALAAILGNGFNLIGWSYIVQVRYYLLMGIMCIGPAALYFIQYRDHPVAFKFLIKTLAFNLPLFIVLYVLKIALPFPDIILLPIIGIIVFSYLIFIQVKYIKNENFIQALTKLRNLPIVH